MKQHMQKGETKQPNMGWQKGAEEGQNNDSAGEEAQNHCVTTMPTLACAFYHELLLKKQPWNTSFVLQCSLGGSGLVPYCNFQQKATVA